MFLIDNILLAPLKGLAWLGDKINDVAEREFSDEGRIKEEFMELQLWFEMDEISEEEYEKQEKVLLARLEAIRKAKEEGI
ncbi:MAG: gas vesicle protein GvpG [Nitrospinae bacterium]|nr:gas vesicle protein GvpG [Nitrospinota bacterium]